MDIDVGQFSNSLMIESLETIIQRENLKLQMDKTTGLLAKIQSKVSKVEQSSNENENIRVVTKNTDNPNNSKRVSHSPEPIRPRDRIDVTVRSAKLSTPSGGSFVTDVGGIRTDVNRSQSLLSKEQTYNNEHDNFKRILQCNKINIIPGTPDNKVKRNVRFGEYSPINPQNQVNSQPFLGIGEYDIKKKKLLQLQRKEYIDYLSKAKREKNMSRLPKLPPFSCEESFKNAMEANCSEPNNLNCGKMTNEKENSINLVPFIDGIESCVLDEEQQKETQRLKQELYRLELNKQIEEKRMLHEEQKYKEQMEDEAIERAHRDQVDKLQREFEKEAEKRTLAQLQKQLAQEKLKNELMKKQRELAAAERVSQQALKHVRSRNASPEDYNDEDVPCPKNSSSAFDNVPLPTTRVRAPRKIDYRDVSCNTDTFNNPCMNQNISLPIVKHRTERAHVSFASDPPQRRNVHNPATLLPVTKSMIIDSPLTLAMAGLDDNDNGTCEAIEPTQAAYCNQTSKEEALLVQNRRELPTDKHLLSNLGNIRKQLDIEHQRLKAQVRKSK